MEGPGFAVGVGVVGEPLLREVQSVAARVDRTGGVDTDEFAVPGVAQDLSDGEPRSAHAGDHHRAVLRLLVDELEAVGETGKGHHRRAVLVIVEDRDVETFLQRVLDGEARRCGDVLEVDATEGRGDSLDGLDDLVGFFRVEADRETIDAGELLEQQRLALHHRHGGFGTDIAEAEHGGAVADDGNRVLLDRVLVGFRHVVMDGHTHAGDPRGVRHGEIVAVGHAAQRQHLDLAAFVDAEGTVPPFDHGDTRQGVGHVDEFATVSLVTGVDVDGARDAGALRLKAGRAGDVAAGFADGDGKTAEGAGNVVENDLQPDGIGGGRDLAHGLRR